MDSARALLEERPEGRPLSVDCTLEHRKGSAKGNADFLYRFARACLGTRPTALDLLLAASCWKA